MSLFDGDEKTRGKFGHPPAPHLAGAAARWRERRRPRRKHHRRRRSPPQAMFERAASVMSPASTAHSMPLE
jgi:hypothetical protein